MRLSGINTLLKIIINGIINSEYVLIDTTNEDELLSAINKMKCNKAVWLQKLPVNVRKVLGRNKVK